MDVDDEHAAVRNSLHILLTCWRLGTAPCNDLDKGHVAPPVCIGAVTLRPCPIKVVRLLKNTRRQRVGELNGYALAACCLHACKDAHVGGDAGQRLRACM